MQFHPQLTFSRFIGRREGRRIPGRLQQDSLECELGPVLDLSAGGMRVLSTRRVDGEVNVSLRGEQVDLKIRCRIAWIRRLGFRRHELGLTFLDLDDEVSKILTRIATDHRARLAV